MCTKMIIFKGGNPRKFIKITSIFTGTSLFFFLLFTRGLDYSPTAHFFKLARLHSEFESESMNMDVFDQLLLVDSTPQFTTEAATTTPVILNGDPIIYLATQMLDYYPQNLSECPVYNNCRIVKGYNDLYEMDPYMMPELREASVIIWSKMSLYNPEQMPDLPWEVRSNQLWILKNLESPAFKYNRYPTWYDGLFNYTISYRSDSDITVGYQRFRLVRRHKQLPAIDYKQGKTKGALAIISNCHSYQYNRLKTIHTMARYIDIDIYGSCGKPDPCDRVDIKCEANLYKQYHFYLAFENSLCKDYVTEKFWERLRSDAYFIPVVFGGIHPHDYKNTPPNSYINLYDFDTSHLLGIYLKNLMDNPGEYNSYHSWRESYYLDETNPLNVIPTCEICRLANVRPKKEPRSHLSDWWNSACSEYDPNK